MTKEISDKNRNTHSHPTSPSTITIPTPTSTSTPPSTFTTTLTRMTAKSYRTTQHKLIMGLWPWFLLIVGVEDLLAEGWPSRELWSGTWATSKSPTSSLPWLHLLRKDLSTQLRWVKCSSNTHNMYHVCPRHTWTLNVESTRTSR